MLLLMIFLIYEIVVSLFNFDKFLILRLELGLQLSIKAGEFLIEL